MGWQDPLSRIQSGDRRLAGITPGSGNGRSNSHKGHSPGNSNAGFFRGHALGRKRSATNNGLTGSGEDGNSFMRRQTHSGGKARFSVDRELKHHGAGARPPLGSDCRTWSGGCPEGMGFSFGGPNVRDSFHHGSKSRTHPGDMDFTTKKGNKVYHRKGHDVYSMSRPYEPKGRVAVAGTGPFRKITHPCVNCGGLKVN